MSKPPLPRSKRMRVHQGSEDSAGEAAVAKIAVEAEALAEAAVAKIEAAAVEAKATIPAEFAKLERESYIRQTSIELGADVKEAAKDDNLCVPQPVDEETTNNVWGKENSEMFAEFHEHSNDQILEKNAAESQLGHVRSEDGVYRSRSRRVKPTEAD